MVQSQTDLNGFLRIRGIVKKSLGTSLLPQVILISSLTMYFEQYPFNNITMDKVEMSIYLPVRLRIYFE